MKINAAGLDIIKREESLQLKAYLCPAGVPTIGYGHTGDVTLADVKSGRTITAHQADVILALDLERFEHGVEELTKGVKLNENQFSALVSFAFNVGLGSSDPRGPTGFKGSQLRSLLFKGDFAGAAREFNRWTHAKGKVLPGLVRRRAAERALFEAKT